MSLSQTCPYCEITEAAGGYCTLCYRPTQPEWVHADPAHQRVTAPRHVEARSLPGVAADTTRTPSRAAGTLGSPHGGNADAVA